MVWFSTQLLLCLLVARRPSSGSRSSSSCRRVRPQHHYLLRDRLMCVMKQHEGPAARTSCSQQVEKVQIDDLLLRSTARSSANRC